MSMVRNNAGVMPTSKRLLELALVLVVVAVVTLMWSRQSPAYVPLMKMPPTDNPSMADTITKVVARVLRIHSFDYALEPVTGIMVLEADRQKILQVLAAEKIPLNGARTEAEQLAMRENLLKMGMEEAFSEMKGFTDVNVRLTLAKETAFKDDSKPTTVLVQLRASPDYDPATTTAIKQAASYSVPDLEQQHVTVIDLSSGRELTSGG